MKKILLLTLTALLALTACKNDDKAQAYSKDRDLEKKKIANFMAVNHYTILQERPADGEAWEPDTYYEIKGYDQMYIHITQVGDTSQKPIVAREHVHVRFRKYTMTNPMQLVQSNWYNDNGYPVEFNYLELTQIEAEAWHLAIGEMKYPEAECLLICPSKWGFSADMNSVTPYIYQLNVNSRR